MEGRKSVLFLPRSPARRSRGLGVGTRAGSPSPWPGPSRESTRCSSNPCPSTKRWRRGANSSNGTRWEWHVWKCVFSFPDSAQYTSHFRVKWNAVSWSKKCSRCDQPGRKDTRQDSLLLTVGPLLWSDTRDWCVCVCVRKTRIKCVGRVQVCA